MIYRLTKPRRGFAGARAGTEVPRNGLGIFAGQWRFTVDRGVNLVRQEAIEPGPAHHVARCGAAVAAEEMKFTHEDRYLDACARHSDRDFLIMPGDEPDAHLGGAQRGAELDGSSSNLR